jgi:hypothetical protein
VGRWRDLGLKAPHDHIDVERIALDAAADATGLIGRDEGRARAKERVDGVAAVGEIEKRADVARAASGSMTNRNTTCPAQVRLWVSP